MAGLGKFRSWKKRRRERGPWFAPDVDWECNKRGFGSRGAARRSSANARFSFATYLCPFCGKWHVANRDKQRGV